MYCQTSIAGSRGDHFYKSELPEAKHQVSQCVWAIRYSSYPCLSYRGFTVCFTVLLFQAESPEETLVVTYGIEKVEPSALARNFRVDPTSGELSVVEDINYELTNNGK